MNYKLLSLLVLVSVMATNCQTDIQCQCSSTKTTTVDIAVSVNSRYDETGHWISEVTLEQERPNRGGFDVDKKPYWTVNITQMSEKCQGTSTKHIMQLTSTVNPRKIHPDYEHFPGLGYYKFHTQPETWDHAREICQGEGADLIIVNSDSESNLVKQLFSRHPSLPGASHSDWIWVGGYELVGLPRQFKTMNGDSLRSTGFISWGTGQPHPATSGIGGYVIINRQSGLLGTTYHKEKEAYICEY